MTVFIVLGVAILGGAIGKWLIDDEEAGMYTALIILVVGLVIHMANK